MKQDSRQCERVIHRLFDRHVDFEKLLDFLWIHKDLQVPTIVHLDVSPNVSFLICFLHMNLISDGLKCSNITLYKPVNVSPCFEIFVQYSLNRFKYRHKFFMN